MPSAHTHGTVECMVRLERWPPVVTPQTAGTPYAWCRGVMRKAMRRPGGTCGQAACAWRAGPPCMCMPRYTRGKQQPTHISIISDIVNPDRAHSREGVMYSYRPAVQLQVSYTSVPMHKPPGYDGCWQRTQALLEARAAVSYAGELRTDPPAAPPHNADTGTPPPSHTSAPPRFRHSTQCFPRDSQGHGTRITA